MLFVVLLAGCGGSTANVEGTVTFDGQPVDGGAISLVPSGSKEPVASARIVGGKYSIVANKKLTPGAYAVQITWMKSTGKKVKNENDPGTEIEETKQVIPAEYNVNSKLTTEVKSGSNTANFELKAGGAVAPEGTGPAAVPKKGGGGKAPGDS
jgi:hypothetical protein